MPFGILWPTFALVALIFVVWGVMVAHRTVHFWENPPSKADLADDGSALSYPSAPGQNFNALFEMPVLYFALVPLLLLTHHADHIQVILAWVFVICRAVHSVIHIGPKKVQPRFMVYLLSCAILLAMWIGFFVDMLHAASLYGAAMGQMQNLQ